MYNLTDLRLRILIPIVVFFVHIRDHVKHIIPYLWSTLQLCSWRQYKHTTLHLQSPHKAQIHAYGSHYNFMLADHMRPDSRNSSKSQILFHYSYPCHLNTIAFSIMVHRNTWNSMLILLKECMKYFRNTYT